MQPAYSPRPRLREMLVEKFAARDQDEWIEVRDAATTRLDSRLHVCVDRSIVVVVVVTTLLLILTHLFCPIRLPIDVIEGV